MRRRDVHVGGGTRDALAADRGAFGERRPLPVDPRLPGPALDALAERDVLLQHQAARVDQPLCLRTYELPAR